MRPIPPRLKDILERKTDHTEARRLAYLKVCVEQGYDLTEVRDLPPAYMLLFNYATAKVKQLAGHQVTDELAQQRLAICPTAPCGLFRIINNQPRCADDSCGCFLEQKVKDSTAKCPKGFW